MKQSEQERQHERHVIVLHRVVAVLAGVGSAFAAASATIRNEFYDDIKNTPEVAKLTRDTGSLLKNLWSRAPRMDPAAYFREMVSIKRDGQQAFNTILKDHHYRSEGLSGFFQGVLDRSKSMSSNSRRDVIINAITVAAVTTGGMLMFFNARHMRRLIDTLEGQQTAESQAMALLLPAGNASVSAAPGGTPARTALHEMVPSGNHAQAETAREAQAAASPAR